MNPPTPAPRGIAAAEVALAHTRRVLVDGFDPSKWLGLAVCAWLAQLATQPPSLNLDLPSSGSLPNLEGFAELWIIAAALAVLAVTMAVWAALTWVRSRGQFMFLDGVVHDRGDIAAPWRAFVAEAWSLTRFRLVLDLLTTVAAIAAGGALWAAYATSSSPVSVEWMLGGAAALFIPLLCAWALVAWLTHEVLVPVMYARQCGVVDAVRALRGELQTHIGAFLTYLFVRSMAGFVVFLITNALGCMLCCLSIVPFVMTAIFLPFSVFLRSLAPAFLVQLGAPYGPLVFAEREPEPEA